MGFEKEEESSKPTVKKTEEKGAEPLAPNPKGKRKSSEIKKVSIFSDKYFENIFIRIKDETTNERKKIEQNGDAVKYLMLTKSAIFKRDKNEKSENITRAEAEPFLEALSTCLSKEDKLKLDEKLEAIRKDNDSKKVEFELAKLALNTKNAIQEGLTASGLALLSEAKQVDISKKYQADIEQAIKNLKPTPIEVVDVTTGRLDDKASIEALMLNRTYTILNTNRQVNENEGLALDEEVFGLTAILPAELRVRIRHEYNQIETFQEQVSYVRNLMAQYEAAVKTNKDLYENLENNRNKKNISTFLNLFSYITLGLGNYEVWNRKVGKFESHDAEGALEKISDLVKNTELHIEEKIFFLAETEATLEMFAHRLALAYDKINPLKANVLLEKGFQLFAEQIQLIKNDILKAEKENKEAEIYNYLGKLYLEVEEIVDLIKDNSNVKAQALRKEIGELSGTRTFQRVHNQIQRMRQEEMEKERIEELKREQLKREQEEKRKLQSLPSLKDPVKPTLLKKPEAISKTLHQMEEEYKKGIIDGPKAKSKDKPVEKLLTFKEEPSASKKLETPNIKSITDVEVKKPDIGIEKNVKQLKKSIKKHSNAKLEVQEEKLKPESKGINSLNVLDTKTKQNIAVINYNKDSVNYHIPTSNSDIDAILPILKSAEEMRQDPLVVSNPENPMHAYQIYEIAKKYTSLVIEPDEETKKEWLKESSPIREQYLAILNEDTKPKRKWF